MIIEISMAFVWFPQQGDRAQTSACCQDLNVNHWLLDNIFAEPVFLHSARCRLHCPYRVSRIHVLSSGWPRAAWKVRGYNHPMEKDRENLPGALRLPLP